jgi:hypothetical protein
MVTFAFPAMRYASCAGPKRAFAFLDKLHRIIKASPYVVIMKRSRLPHQPPESECDQTFTFETLSTNGGAPFIISGNGR